jgi:hypothetical protein
MNIISNFFSDLSDWLPLIIIFALMGVYLAVTSRWEAYSRRKNYEELKYLNELREKSIITQKEFEEKKDALLNA